MHTTAAAQTAPPTAADLDARIAGHASGPGDSAYDAARQAFNLAIDQRPALVAVPADAGDVASVVSFARDHGFRVAPQRTGHNAGPLGSLERTVLLKTDALVGVEIDAEAHTARAGAGNRWEDVVPAASRVGLAALHGSTPDVSLAGYSLGGGLGWYARRYGLQTNSVTAIELVTADGELVRADASHEPDLFWALRGGGGNFGVVCALEFDLYPVAELYAGALFFPWERSSDVLHAWRDWAATVPETVTSVGRLLQLPPLPEIPEPLRGGSFAVLEAACLTGEAEGAALLEPLRELGPDMDTFAMTPPVGIAELHMDPREPVPYVSGDRLLTDFPTAAVDALIESAGPGSGSPLLSVEVRHLGGALARSEGHHGALAALDGSHLMFAVGMAMDEPMAAAMDAHIERVQEALEPWGSGRYLNFAERPLDLGEAFPPDAQERLRAVKRRYDPDGVFHANHAIG